MCPDGVWRWVCSDNVRRWVCPDDVRRWVCPHGPWRWVCPNIVCIWVFLVRLQQNLPLPCHSSPRGVVPSIETPLDFLQDQLGDSKGSSRKVRCPSMPPSCLLIFLLPRPGRNIMGETRSREGSSLAYLYVGQCSRQGKGQRLEMEWEQH